MFRILDGKINIFGKWVAMQPGSHRISIDNGSIVTDGNGADVCIYTLGSDGSVAIESKLDKESFSGEKPINGLATRFERIVGRAPLYQEPLGVGPDLTTVIEGFLFSFNYYALANIVIALKPFMWTGGRVCFKSMFTPTGEGAVVHQYTAIPAAGSCGTKGWDLYSERTGIIGVNPFLQSFGFLAAVQRDAIEFYGNSVSVAFSYRTHRKYLFFASNVYGMYSSPVGYVSGADGGYPAGGPIPDPGNKSFQFSMFSLRQ
jgi:hypothetical protein